MEESRFSTRSLRNRALFGICVIVGFILISQLSIYALIIDQTSNSRVINLAGRQRMLSQQLTKDILILQYISDPVIQETHIDELDETLRSWQLAHTGLQMGDDDLGLPGSNSQFITDLFAVIEADFQEMVIAGNCILLLETGAEASGCDGDMEAYVQTILLHEKDFLAGMNAIVFQYDQEAHNALEYTHYFNYMLALLGCVGVISIWFGVLRPAIHRVENMYKQLQTQSDALAIARDEALYAASIKSQILMNLSHDARTPLTSIIVSADMITRTDDGSLSKRQHERLNNITQSAKRLNTFLQNMLDQAKLQTRSMQLMTTHIQAEELEEELKHVLKPLAESKGLNWALSYQPDFPSTIYGDKTRILQILTNLGNNAIKFTEQGQVSIYFLTYDVNYWGFRVQDTGKGISPDAQEHIFDQFWQEDGSMTRQHQSGVGLGLAIVHSLINLMEGRIYVKSEVNQGTEFEVWIPFKFGTDPD